MYRRYRAPLLDGACLRRGELLLAGAQPQQGLRLCVVPQQAPLLVAHKAAVALQLRVQPVGQQQLQVHSQGSP